MEVAAIGINLVSMANNHALDFGQEGLKECLRALDLTQITHAGAGLTLADAHEPGTMDVQSQKTKFALLVVHVATGRRSTAAPIPPGLAWRRSTRR